jgi:hypothetical protein
MTFARFVLLPAVLTAFAACDSRPALPGGLAGAVPVAPSSTPPPVSGTVAIRSISPAPGATVRVRSCPPGPLATFTTLCTDQVRATIDVRLDADVTPASVVVAFADGPKHCGQAEFGARAFTAGVTSTIDVATIYLAAELSEGVGSPARLVQPCQLPVTTSRVVVQIWRPQNAVTPVMTREFAGTYTFTDR